MEPETLSSTQAAGLLNCTRQNISDLLRRGKIAGPPRDRGAPVRIYADSLRTYQQQKNRNQRRVNLPATHIASDGAELNQLRVAVLDLQLQVSRLRTALEQAHMHSKQANTALMDLNTTHEAVDEAEMEALNARLAAIEAQSRQIIADIAQKKAAHARWTQAMDAAGLYDLRDIT